MINYKEVDFGQRISDIQNLSGVSTWAPLDISISEKELIYLLKKQKELLTDQLKENEIERKQIMALANTHSLAFFNIGFNPEKGKELQKGIDLINQMLYEVKSFFNFKSKKSSSDFVKDFLTAKVSIPNFILGVDTLYIE